MRAQHTQPKGLRSLHGRAHLKRRKPHNPRLCKLVRLQVRSAESVLHTDIQVVAPINDADGCCTFKPQAGLAKPVLHTSTSMTAYGMSADAAAHVLCVQAIHLDDHQTFVHLDCLKLDSPCLTMVQTSVCSLPVSSKSQHLWLERPTEDLQAPFQAPAGRSLRMPSSVKHPPVCQAQ